MESLYQEVGGCGPFQAMHASLVQSTRVAVAWVIYLMVFGAFTPDWRCVVLHADPAFPLGGAGSGNVHHHLNGSTIINGINDNNSNNSSSSSGSSSINATLNGYPECLASLALTSLISSQSSPSSLHVPYNQSGGEFPSFIANNDSNYSNDSHDSHDHSHRHLYFEGGDETCACHQACDVILFDPESRTIVTEFGLICDQAFVPSIIICIQMIGMLVGATLGGQIGERFGRKVSVYCNLALCSVAALLAIWSPSWQVYAAFMFLVGAGSGGVMVTNIMYTMEYLEPKWRGRVSGVPTWNVSVGLFALAIVLLKDWVHVHIAASCVCALSCVGALWTPESLRWLMVHGKEKEARKVIAKLLKVNGVKDRAVDELMEKITAAEGGVGFGEKSDRKYTYLDLFRGRHIRWVTIKLSVICFFSFMTYYALSFSVKSLAGDFYVNVLVAGVSEIPAVMIVAPMTNTCGRRLSVVIFLLGMALGSFTAVAAYYAAGDDGVGGTVITYAAFFAKGSAIACLNAVCLFAVELFPTAVRNLGMAFTGLAGKFGNILAPYLIPRDRSSVVVSYIILGVAALGNVALAMMLSETKSRSLKDSLGEDEEDGEREGKEMEILVEKEEKEGEERGNDALVEKGEKREEKKGEMEELVEKNPKSLKV